MVKIISALLFFSLCAARPVSAQTLTAQDIWYKLLKDNDEKILVKKGFASVYSGPKKMGGYLSCYRNKTADEWLFVHADSLYHNTAVHYYLPNFKNYLRQLTDKKTLLDGEDYDVLGKTYEQGKVYYQIRYTYNLDLPKPVQIKPLNDIIPAQTLPDK